LVGTVAQFYELKDKAVQFLKASDTLLKVKQHLKENNQTIDSIFPAFASNNRITTKSDATVCVLLTEFLDGPDVWNVIDSGSASFEDKLHILMGHITALCVLQQANIAHLDAHCGNTMVVYETEGENEQTQQRWPRAVLLDFGNSQVLQPNSSSVPIQRNPHNHYSPPELQLDSPDRAVTIKADVWTHAIMIACLFRGAEFHQSNDQDTPVSSVFRCAACLFLFITLGLKICLE